MGCFELSPTKSRAKTTKRSEVVAALDKSEQQKTTYLKR